MYGRVISGIDICNAAEAIKTGANDKPLTSIVVTDCGELLGNDKLTQETAEYLKHYDSVEADE